MFLPSQASFSSRFLKIVVEVEASGPPHVIKQWLQVSKGTVLPEASGPPHVIKQWLPVSKGIVLPEASGPPHVIKQWLPVSKGIVLPVLCFRSNKTFFVSVEFLGDHKTFTRLG